MPEAAAHTLTPPPRFLGVQYVCVPAGPSVRPCVRSQFPKENTGRGKPRPDPSDCEASASSVSQPPTCPRSGARRRETAADTVTPAGPAPRFPGAQTEV